MSRNVKFLQTVTTIPEDKKGLFEEANTIMQKLDLIVSSLKKLEKIKIFQPYLPISNELKSTVLEKYEEVFKF